jgi:hypothetical protein
MGLALPVEARRELGQDAMGSSEDAPVARDCVGVVAGVQGVVGERRAVPEVKGFRMDVDIDSDLAEDSEKLQVEVRARRALSEFYRPFLAVAGGDQQPVIEQIEQDLHISISTTIGHGSGAQATCRRQQGDVPPVVSKRHERHPNLADDLRVAVQCLLSRLPILIRQRRPELGGAVVAHKRSFRMGLPSKTNRRYLHRRRPFPAKRVGSNGGGMPSSVPNGGEMIRVGQRPTGKSLEARMPAVTVGTAAPPAGR